MNIVTKITSIPPTGMDSFTNLYLMVVEIAAKYGTKYSITGEELDRIRQGFDSVVELADEKSPVLLAYKAFRSSLFSNPPDGKILIKLCDLSEKIQQSEQMRGLDNYAFAALSLGESDEYNCPETEKELIAVLADIEQNLTSETHRAKLDAIITKGEGGNNPGFQDIFFKEITWILEIKEQITNIDTDNALDRLDQMYEDKDFYNGMQVALALGHSGIPNKDDKERTERFIYLSEILQHAYFTTKADEALAGLIQRCPYTNESKFDSLKEVLAQIQKQIKAVSIPEKTVPTLHPENFSDSIKNPDLDLSKEPLSEEEKTYLQVVAWGIKDLARDMGTLAEGSPERVNALCQRIEGLRSEIHKHVDPLAEEPSNYAEIEPQDQPNTYSEAEIFAMFTEVHQCITNDDKEAAQNILTGLNNCIEDWMESEKFDEIVKLSEANEAFQNKFPNPG